MSHHTDERNASVSASALGRSLTLITPPAEQPLTLAQVKEHLRVEPTDTDEDALITRLMQGAVAALDGADGSLNRALVTQTWDMRLDRFPRLPTQAIRLPLPPTQSVGEIEYVDLDYATQIWDAANYRLFLKDKVWRVAPERGQQWPAAATDEIQPVRIRFTCGYGDAAAVPDEIVSGMLIWIANYFANREDVVVGTIASRLPWGVERLVGRYRIGGFT